MMEVSYREGSEWSCAAAEIPQVALHPSSRVSHIYTQQLIKQDQGQQHLPVENAYCFPCCP